MRTEGEQETIGTNRSGIIVYQRVPSAHSASRSLIVTVKASLSSQNQFLSPFLEAVNITSMESLMLGLGRTSQHSAEKRVLFNSYYCRPKQSQNGTNF